jgi:hypothetical protein
MQRDFGRADAIREELRVRLGVLVHDARTLILTPNPGPNPDSDPDPKPSR